mmetsp:Transcript_3947/g.14008  ORF Transcript_3947/g.14008 Transcript_3947/m.14008 type:complete len:214 (+) Transcript_3947:2463-3104(+)
MGTGGARIILLPDISTPMLLCGLPFMSCSEERGRLSPLPLLVWREGLVADPPLVLAVPLPETVRLLRGCQMLDRKRHSRHMHSRCALRRAVRSRCCSATDSAIMLGYAVFTFSERRSRDSVERHSGVQLRRPRSFFSPFLRATSPMSTNLPSSSTLGGSVHILQSAGCEVSMQRHAGCPPWFPLGTCAAGGCCGTGCSGTRGNSLPSPWWSPW